ncbi:MAG TPA: alpha-amylase family glycosyl hydrolase [Bacteroidota bacterium]|nr:alpha-amylase family glycosyl hydrolase [Bacteroidota bacterium]
MQTPLPILADTIAEKLSRFSSDRPSYFIPPLWTGSQRNAHGQSPVAVNPAAYFPGALRQIASAPAQTVLRGAGGSWSKETVIFNMFVRSTCAFDHNQNGKLDLPLNGDGWRETGTFLKATALLPYIKSLGATTIHLLPITSIGTDGNKGSLGSPYAIKNPYLIDENLAEPNLGIGVDAEFRMFVAAAHHLGMRVVVEFVFRTASKNGDWIAEHPEWFYWIRESVHDRGPGSHEEGLYGNPLFTPEELAVIKDKVKKEDFSSLPQPHDIYRSMFTKPPEPSRVRLVKGSYRGLVDGNTTVRIPGAFADWPPDDSQPPWNDVTYLKLYDHPDFNYIAYNTLRMYDTRLAVRKNANEPLWQKIIEILPHYQKEFGIDGVMIDMGHALPMELKQEMIRRARSINPEFSFWDENFSITEKSVLEGYNAVIGYQWSDQHHPEKFRTMLRRFGGEGYAVPYFATPESHNTPRAAARPGGIVYSSYAWAVSNFIPAIPFIHSGFELGETFPVNTGLDFTREDLKKYPSETLPLFSEGAYAWMNEKELTGWISSVSGVRKRYAALITESSPESFVWCETGSADAFAFLRTSRRLPQKLLILANPNMAARSGFKVTVPTSKTELKNLLAGGTLKPAGGVIEGSLAPGEVVVVEL